MFKKILKKILLTFKAIPSLCVGLIKQLLKLLFASFFYALAIALMLIGLCIVGGHTYMFLKTGEWTLLASPDMPFTLLLEAEWMGAWKIYRWLPASLFFFAAGVGVLFLYPKIKKLVPGMAAPMPVAETLEPAAITK